MRKTYKNQYGVEVAWLRKEENWPGTKHITGKQGFWVYSPNQGDSWEYLGPIAPLKWLEEIYGPNTEMKEKKTP